MNIELLAITDDPEAIIEQAARTCYQSNDRAGGDNTAKLLGKLLASGHDTPFEHAYATFRISGCSRAMTHQLVRHRLMSASQRSQRYVSEKAFEYVTPPSIAKSYKEEYETDMATIQELYAKWKSRKIKNEDARFVLPNACATEIVISANFREFRHIFTMRCDKHAQWEIQEAAREMLVILYEKAPAVFDDMYKKYITPSTP